MRTGTLLVTGTLLCMAYSGVLGYLGFVLRWQEYLPGNFIIFFLLFMLRAPRN